MKYRCGSISDVREIEINLPTQKSLLGVFVSGGIDSALLYYLLLTENVRLNCLHEIIPFSLARREGATHYAGPVVSHIHKTLNLPLLTHLSVGDVSLEERAQVTSGIHDAYSAGCDIVYVGSIEQMPQHAIGWTPFYVRDTERFKVPLLPLNKSHVIDLVVQLNLQSLFYITHACSSVFSSDNTKRCNNCNGCNERAWGFEQNSLSDPGYL